MCFCFTHMHSYVLCILYFLSLHLTVTSSDTGGISVNVSISKPHLSQIDPQLQTQAAWSKKRQVELVFSFSMSCS